MKAIKYIILIIHIVAVVSVMVYTLTCDHAVLGREFNRCERSNNDIYLIENTKNHSILYKGDHQGKISSVYRSNQGQRKVSIVGFNVAEDVYILEKSKEGYSIKKFSEDRLIALSKSRPFGLNDVEEISDFYVSLSDEMVYITAIRTGGIGVNVYSYNLSGLFPLGSEETELQSGETAMDLPVRFRYDAVSEVVTDAYFDGTNIITEARPPVENAIDPRNYSGIMKLTAGQSLKVNIDVFLIYVTYAIAGLLVIILVIRLLGHHRSFIDNFIINEIFIIAGMAIGVFMLGNTPLILTWAALFSIANIIIVWFESRDIRVLCNNMKRVIAGNLEFEKPRGNSAEIATLWRGMNEVKYLYEEYKYAQDTTIAAVLRFLPHNIGAMFNSNSLDEIKPGDSVFIPGTFMTLRTKKEISNNLIRMTEDYEKKTEGTLLTGECSVSEIRMLFSKPKSEEVDLGLHFFSEIGDDSACSLYFNDNFKISVIGTDTKTILNVTSSKMETMERLAEWFFDMGIRMVISEEVKELNEGIKSPLRYIGYCNIGGEKKSFYEVLNTYGEKTRSNRLKCLEDFDRALTLLYKNDFYLARTAFTEILKVDPGDELARWYLFVCEKYLNDPDGADRSCALDPRN